MFMIIYSKPGAVFGLNWQSFNLKMFSFFRFLPSVPHLLHRLDSQALVSQGEPAEGAKYLAEIIQRYIFIFFQEFFIK
jgi:hypothetical protein